MQSYSFAQFWLTTILVLCSLTGLGCQPAVERLAADIDFTPHDQDLPARLASESREDRREAEASFVLTNSSKQANEIFFQGTSCGCTGAFVAKEPLNPGDKLTLEPAGAIHVTLRSHLSGAPGVWTYRASFGFPGEKPNKDPVTAVFHLHVLRDIALEPGVLSCDFTTADTRPIEKVMRVTRIFRAEKPTVLPPTFSNLSPQIEVLEVEEAGSLTRLEDGLWEQSWSVKFGVKPPAGGANVSALGHGAVTLPGIGGGPSVSSDFPIILHRVYGIEAPELSHFGDVPAGERRVRKLVIRSANGSDFEILRLRTDSEAFSISCEVGAPHKSHTLEAVFKASRPGAFQGHIFLETNHAECPTLTISLAATIPSETAITNADGTEATHKP